MNPSSKIYVAGHTGLVGSAILQTLQSQGHNNLILRTHGELDLEMQKDVNDFFEKERPEYVFLAAAKVGGIYANNTYPADFIYNNLIIQVNVIHSAYKYRVKKLLFLGSSCIYPRLAPQPMKEEYLLTGLLEPTNEPYALAKIAGIKMCQAYNRQYGTCFISIIPANVYGMNDHFNEDGHVLASLIQRFHEAKVEGSNGVTIWGTGRPKREFFYADDLAEALIFLMHEYNEDEAINVGTGVDISIAELAELIKETVGFKGDVHYDTTKPDGNPVRLLDTSRMNALGWKPKISLEEGLRITYEWYKTFT